ncbi:MAG: hypothetical protein BWX88_04160 [Planctomycetes bacterium ADurb.Bin126]|nr:MAG: hypothetical protein BWX88_04160 [Planctomycetes bacterium ADurb.Bin126]HOD80338.1 hypothetical protein [Phycisphaerae bacterium]HQL75693.1 hypothetical protein [Phycisphaerae bacterium]
MGTRLDMATTILDGMVSGWVLVFSAVAAFVVGTAVGLVSVGGPAYAHVGYAVIGVFLFPVLMFTSIPRLIVGVCLFALLMRYWLIEERRLERLYLLTAFSAAMVWMTFGAESWGPAVWITGGLLMGGYVGLRLLPGWRIQRLEAKVDLEIAQRREQRLAELRQGRSQTQNEVDQSAATAASLFGADYGPDDIPPASPPPSPRPPGMDLLETDE